MSNSELNRINKAKKELVNLLAGEPGFVGAGIASAEARNFEIVVFVAEINSGVIDKVPKVWKEFTVRIEVSGDPKKF